MLSRALRIASAACFLLAVFHVRVPIELIALGLLLWVVSSLF